MSYRTDLSKALERIDRRMKELVDDVAILKGVVEYHFSENQKPLPPNVMKNLEDELMEVDNGTIQHEGKR